MRASREEWAKRVERWRESGLSAEQYASELGINAGTLKFWKYQLGRPATKTSPVRSRPEVQSKELPLVEVRAAVTTPSTTHFELELRGGRCLRIPATFEDAALKRLVRVLEELT
jgi:hypothetical protein